MRKILFCVFIIIITLITAILLENPNFIELYKTIYNIWMMMFSFCIFFPIFLLIITFFS